MRPIDADALDAELARSYKNIENCTTGVKWIIGDVRRILACQPSIKSALKLRPCVCDGRPARFHRWCEWSKLVPPALARGGGQGGEQRYVLALVEFEDGTVDAVPLYKIRFTDGATVYGEGTKHDD